jgi:hypothetical protein
LNCKKQKAGGVSYLLKLKNYRKKVSEEKSKAGRQSIAQIVNSQSKKLNVSLV